MEKNGRSCLKAIPCSGSDLLGGNARICNRMRGVTMKVVAFLAGGENPEGEEYPGELCSQLGLNRRAGWQTPVRKKTLKAMHVVGL